jgi:hypothetical protein
MASRNIRRLFWFGVAGILFLVSTAPLGRSQNAMPSEYKLKAAFLFNFAKFVDWPEGTFVNSQSAFAVCVLGKDPFGHLLDDALSSKKIADRPVVVERLKDKGEARRCQMVFVSATEGDSLPAVLDAVRGASVLLIGETPDFAASGGTIEFTLEDSRIRFLINTDAADRARLRVDSKLLALAKVVHDEGRSSKGG